MKYSPIYGMTDEELSIMPSALHARQDNGDDSFDLDKLIGDLEDCKKANEKRIADNAARAIMKLYKLSNASLYIFPILIRAEKTI